MASTFKIYDGQNWVDPCNCNVNIRTSSNDWKLVDPKNCNTRYWTGTEWCPIECGCRCSDGYTFNSANNKCEKEGRLPATDSGGTFYPIGLGNRTFSFGDQGGRLYQNITGLTYPLNASSGVIRDNAGLGTPLTLTLSNVNNTIFDSQWTTTEGRLNQTSIWPTGYPNDEWFTVRFCLNITVPKTYIIGIACDNQARISITSDTFPGAATELNLVNLWDSNSPTGVPTTQSGFPFNYWHMFPIDLPVGDHVIKLAGYNIGDTSAGLGTEVYDISVTDMLALMASTTATTADLEPYIMFTTRELIQEPPLKVPAIGQTGTNYTCPYGTTFTDCYGVPQCVGITSYFCEGMDPCSISSFNGGGDQGMYKIPIRVPANVCGIQIEFNVNSIPDSLAILNFDETQYYAQTGFFGDINTSPTVGSYTFGGTGPLLIFNYDPAGNNNFSVDTVAPLQTIEIISNQFPITNTDPNKIPLAWNTNNMSQTTRAVTWNKGATPSDVLAIIRIVGNPNLQGTDWIINSSTCINC